MNSIDLGILLPFIVLISVIVLCALIYGTRGGASFQRIKDIIGTKDICLPDLYQAIDKINKVSKGTYTLVDAVKIKLYGCDFDLIKCHFSSIGFGSLAGGSDSNYGSPTSYDSTVIYILSLDKASSEIAKGMCDLLKLRDASENIAIFNIKSFGRLEEKIEQENYK
jgi:hypothetical protein